MSVPEPNYRSTGGIRAEVDVEPQNRDFGMFLNDMANKVDAMWSYLQDELPNIRNDIRNQTDVSKIDDDHGFLHARFGVENRK